MRYLSALSTCVRFAVLASPNTGERLCPRCSWRLLHLTAEKPYVSTNVKSDLCCWRNSLPATPRALDWKGRISQKDRLRGGNQSPSATAASDDCDWEFRVAQSILRARRASASVHRSSYGSRCPAHNEAHHFHGHGVRRRWCLSPRPALRPGYEQAKHFLASACILRDRAR